MQSHNKSDLDKTSEPKKDKIKHVRAGSELMLFDMEGEFNKPIYPKTEKSAKQKDQKEIKENILTKKPNKLNKPK